MSEGEGEAEEVTVAVPVVVPVPVRVTVALSVAELEDEGEVEAVTVPDILIELEGVMEMEEVKERDDVGLRVGETLGLVVSVAVREMVGVLVGVIEILAVREAVLDVVGVTEAVTVLVTVTVGVTEGDGVTDAVALVVAVRVLEVVAVLVVVGVGEGVGDVEAASYKIHSPMLTNVCPVCTAEMMRRKYFAGAAAVVSVYCKPLVVQPVTLVRLSTCVHEVPVLDDATMNLKGPLPRVVGRVYRLYALSVMGAGSTICSHSPEYEAPFTDVLPDPAYPPVEVKTEFDVQKQ